jgi:hypothetical protein
MTLKGCSRPTCKDIIWNLPGTSHVGRLVLELVVPEKHCGSSSAGNLSVLSLSSEFERCLLLDIAQRTIYPEASRDHTQGTCTEDKTLPRTQNDD